MRNPDPAPRRFTSLAWAAVLGHEETFEFLLAAGHDDDELSKVCMILPLAAPFHNSNPLFASFHQDSENNTILMLLSDLKPSSASSPYQSRPDVDIVGAALRMSKLYYDRYTWILDWSNVHGKTALHVAALKGNEELVRVSMGFLASECKLTL
jgi:ankyrin repeat protein